LLRMDLYCLGYDMWVGGWLWEMDSRCSCHCGSKRPALFKPKVAFIMDKTFYFCLSVLFFFVFQQVVLDLTFGAGGHSKAILQSVPGITVVAADRDPTVFQMAQHLAEEYPGRVKPGRRFSELNNLLPALGFGPGGVDAALLDAGCSSMQMDSAETGFSLSKNGLLDMRMDGDRYPDMPCVADVVNALDQQALASVLAAYGEERHTRKIAAAIAQARSIYPIGRTLQLASIVAGTPPH
uniref:Probable methyltransferase-like protein 15 n=1 Tax=Sinocyclocheilus rhinocerous TaxID=307959 RepID=A0A673JZW1_9TELE